MRAAETMDFKAKSPLKLTYKTVGIELELSPGEDEPYWMNYWVDGSQKLNPDRQYFFGRLNNGEFFVLIRSCVIDQLRPVFDDAMKTLAVVWEQPKEG